MASGGKISDKGYIGIDVSILPTIRFSKFMSKEKHVLLIAPQPFFESRGTPLNVRAIAETLGAKANCRVDLLVFPFGQELQIPNVTIHRTWPVPFIKSVAVGPSFAKLFLDVSLVLKAIQLSLRNSYDVFHGIEEGAFIAGVLSRFGNKHFVFDMDSCMETQLQDSSIIGTSLAARIFGFLERRAVVAASVVLTVCTALSEKVRRYSPATRVVQIEDFPTEGSETGDPLLVSSIRQEFGFGGDEKLIVYTGNFERYQGIDLLLESFARICDQLNSRLVLVGGGVPGGQLFEYYREKAHALGIAQHVTFCGNRPLAEMGSFMAIADCLVSPRIEGENTPLKLYSYMSSGKPVVASKIYSHTQVLDDDSAFLAECEAESFAQALADSLGDSELARERQERRAQRSLELVEKYYNRASFDRRLVELYNSLEHDGVSECSSRVVATQG